MDSDNLTLTAADVTVIKLGLRQLLGRTLNISGSLVYANEIVGPVAAKITKLAALAQPTEAPDGR